VEADSLNSHLPVMPVALGACDPGLFTVYILLSFGVTCLTKVFLYKDFSVLYAITF
jgi:hypothetical protein